MKVSATLKGVVDELGRRTVYIRKSNGTERKFYSTDIKIEPKYWKKKVVSHPNSKRINDKIRSLIISYESGIDKPDLSFHKYALECLNEWQHSKRPSTLKSIYSKITRFKEFYNGSISFPSTVLTKFVSYCYSKGNKTNSVWVALKNIRLIVRKAHKEKLIAENPFDSFIMPKYQDPQKIYLTKKQVEKIEKKLPRLGNLKIAAAWFLISCYTGLRYSDQKNFNKSKIKDGRLIVYTFKTGKIVSIPLNQKLKELFRLVGYKPVPYENQPYNRMLKAIGALCEIKEHLTCHTARHTFGTLCASAGISQEVTASLMGHNSIRTTAIYYQITGTRIDSEFKKLF